MAKKIQDLYMEAMSEVHRIKDEGRDDEESARHGPYIEAVRKANDIWEAMHPDLRIPYPPPPPRI